MVFLAGKTDQGTIHNQGTDDTAPNRLDLFSLMIKFGMAFGILDFFSFAAEQGFSCNRPSKRPPRWCRAPCLDTRNGIDLGRSHIEKMELLCTI